MRKIDDRLIEEAFVIAKRGEFHNKHGVIIARGKEVLASGYNRNIGVDYTLNMYREFYSMHAELDAIRKMPFKFEENCTLYSIRRSRNLAFPCAKCMRIIQKTGINRIVYSVKPGVIEEMFI